MSKVIEYIKEKYLTKQVGAEQKALKEKKRKKPLKALELIKKELYSDDSDLGYC
ncbi:MAG: hypothetical protein GY705_06235 [Bacteroidetes bacterium]|nr:hypothetical protein [Bacteroidota bacterium]